MKKDIEHDYGNATHEDYWPQVITYLEAAAPWMLKTLERNVDPDFAGVEALQHGPTNSDLAEFNFAHADRCCKITNAQTQAWLGLAHCMSMKLMAGKGDVLHKCRLEVLRDEKKGVSIADDRDKKVAEKVKAKEFTNFFKLPRELRMSLIKDVSLNYDVSS